MRLIDADALTELFEQDDDMFRSQDIRHIVRKAKTIDAVEVVRCEDCWKVDTNFCPMKQPAFAQNEGFCNCGERESYAIDRR